MNPAAPATDMHARNVLGIVAGGGALPLALIQHCKQVGRPYFIIALEGYADLKALAGEPHAAVRLGAVGESLEKLRSAGAQELVMAGHVKRPSIASLRPDKVGAKLLAKLGTAFFSGDDALLKAVMAFLEEEGFTVVGADDVLSSLLCAEGAMGKVQPDARALEDVERGIKVAQALGALDVGQAVVVEHGYVLGVEAAEGTDGLITRCAALKRAQGAAGVLVKLKKPAQDGRADLPAIGVDTVKAVAKAGLCGIAVQVGGSIVLDKEAVVAQADALGVFVVGVRA